MMKSNSLLVVFSFGAVVWAASPALAQRGACCIANAGFSSCSVTASSKCTGAGVVYAGDGTSCATAACLGSPRGACCSSSSNACVVVDNATGCDFVSADAVYLGNGTSCDEDSNPFPHLNRCATGGGVSVPAVGEWGLGGLALLLLSGVALKFGRRRAAA